MTIPFTKDNIVFWYNTLSIAQEGIVFTLALFTLFRIWDIFTKLVLKMLMFYNLGLISLYIYHYLDTYDEYIIFCKDNKTAMIVSLFMLGTAFFVWIVGILKSNHE